MKKNLKKVTVICIVLTMLLSMANIPVFAATASPHVSLPQKYSATLYSPLSAEDNTTCLGTVSDASKVTIKSSNTSVATAKVSKYDFSGSAYYTLYVTAKKAGKTVITTRVNNTNYTSTVYVSKYVNPISSIRIANTARKTTIAGSKYNTGRCVNLKRSLYANKRFAYNVKVRGSWKLSSINLYMSGWKKEECIYNEIFANGNSPIRNAKTFLVGNKYTRLTITVKNIKSGREEVVYINFK